MKLTFLSILPLLASGVCAFPTRVGRHPTIVQRDGDAIQSILADIDTQVKDLDDSILAKPLDPQAVLSKSKALVEAINSGASNVDGQGALNDLEALGLVGPTQTLAADTKQTIDDLVSIKSDIISTGFACTTLQNLQDQYAAAQALSKAIVSKVPSGLQSTAQGLSDSISTAVKTGVDAFQDSCSSSSASGTPPASSTPTSSSPVIPSSSIPVIPTPTPTVPPSSSTPVIPTSTAIPPSTSPNPTSTPSDPTPTGCAPGTEITVYVSVTVTEAFPWPTWFPWPHHGHA